MLEALGLTSREEAVYQALLDGAAMTEAELRDLTGMATFSAALRALQDKGLVARMAGRPTRYSAAPPEVAVEMLIRAREEELQRIRVNSLVLTERFRAARPRHRLPRGLRHHRPDRPRAAGGHRVAHHARRTGQGGLGGAGQADAGR
ncbi:sugar-specific transcriptional regulator TrmB [Streptosporangium album]|uniref:Sugar-specific transcriptional regulator TrmB n=1 Tax=Streptosporangium album TaxID=47479 RepID=A0A7W7S3Y5_9ACTN|nr:helix-turn-helix domain-containing protein [Streptosporangium album]MBB4943430.1 sugar-specific transcriptional regulator TrmB [Streptosporangium album]